MIEYFNAYVKIGLKVIPLYPNSKVPVCKSWQTNWDENKYREIFEKYSKSNIGLLLGLIVDVEGDSEDANKFLIDLIGDVPHPMYRSSKSTHHLFLNPDPKLTIFCIRNIEFRAYRHQSVLPPSSHADGSKYQWLRKTKFPIPDMPSDLLAFYLKHNSQKPLIKQGHMKVWCSVCNKKKFIHQKRFLLEQKAFATFDNKWMCHSCRKIDVRELCRKIKKLA